MEIKDYNDFLLNRYIAYGKFISNNMHNITEKDLSFKNYIKFYLEWVN